MTKDEALRLALEALSEAHYVVEHRQDVKKREQAITAIKAALEAKDEPVGLIESLKEAKPCCGQYETCWRACTPRGMFIGQRDAQRTWVGLTDVELAEYADMEIGSYDRCLEVEAKLKEKNT